MLSSKLTALGSTGVAFSNWSSSEWALREREASTWTRVQWDDLPIQVARFPRRAAANWTATQQWERSMHAAMPADDELHVDTLSSAAYLFLGFACLICCLCCFCSTPDEDHPLPTLVRLVSGSFGADEEGDSLLPHGAPRSHTRGSQPDKISRNMPWGSGGANVGSNEAVEAAWRESRSAGGAAAKVAAGGAHRTGTSTDRGTSTVHGTATSHGTSTNRSKSTNRDGTHRDSTHRDGAQGSHRDFGSAAPNKEGGGTNCKGATLEAEPTDCSRQVQIKVPARGGEAVRTSGGGSPSNPSVLTQSPTASSSRSSERHGSLVATSTSPPTSAASPPTVPEEVTEKSPTGTDPAGGTAEGAVAVLPAGGAAGDGESAGGSGGGYSGGTGGESAASAHGASAVNRAAAEDVAAAAGDALATAAVESPSVALKPPIDPPAPATDEPASTDPPAATNPPAAAPGGVPHAWGASPAAVASAAPPTAQRPPALAIPEPSPPARQVSPAAASLAPAQASLAPAVASPPLAAVSLAPAAAFTRPRSAAGLPQTALSPIGHLPQAQPSQHEHAPERASERAREVSSLEAAVLQALSPRPAEARPIQTSPAAPLADVAASVAPSAAAVTEAAAAQSADTGSPGAPPAAAFDVAADVDVNLTMQLAGMHSAPLIDSDAASARQSSASKRAWQRQQRSKRRFQSSSLMACSTGTGLTERMTDRSDTGLDSRRYDPPPKRPESRRSPTPESILESPSYRSALCEYTTEALCE